MGSYRERLSVPVSWWIIAAALVITLFVITYVPVGTFAGVLVGGTALCCWSCSSSGTAVRRSRWTPSDSGPGGP